MDPQTKSKKQNQESFSWLRKIFCLGNCDDHEDGNFNSFETGREQNQILLGQYKYNPIACDQNSITTSLKKKNINPNIQNQQEENNLSSFNHALTQNIVYHLNKNFSIFYLLQNTVKKFITGTNSETVILNNKLDSNQNSLICKFIAQQCSSFTSVLDVFPNRGEYSIEFSKVCEFVVALTNQQQKEEIINEIKLSRCSNNVEIVLTDLKYQNLSKFKSDLIFINLLNKVPETVFSQVLKITRNIIILVSPDFDIQKFTDPLSQYAQANADQMNSIGIQIQDIYFNERLTCKVIYYGSICTFDHDSQLHSLGANILLDGSSCKYHDVSQAIFTILDLAYFRLGTLPFNKIIQQCTQKFSSKGKMIDNLLDILLNQEIINTEELIAIVNRSWNLRKNPQNTHFNQGLENLGSIVINVKANHVIVFNIRTIQWMRLVSTKKKFNNLVGDMSQMNYPYESFVKDMYSDTSSIYVGQIYSEETVKKPTPNSDNYRSENLKLAPRTNQTTNSFFELTQ